jgi:hypothetical protein
VSELKPCPFCSCEMRIESNRDWHRLHGNHSEQCMFDADNECAMVPATDEQLQLLIREWNTRTSGWQPIETAPKSDATVDIWSDKFGRCADCFRVCNRHYENGKSIILDATHWMPVEPPNEQS